jgi:hypothetical protein
MPSGLVKWFSPTKGYGFIEPSTLSTVPISTPSKPITSVCSLIKFVFHAHKQKGAVCGAALMIEWPFYHQFLQGPLQPTSIFGSACTAVPY